MRHCLKIMTTAAVAALALGACSQSDDMAETSGYADMATADSTEAMVAEEGATGELSALDSRPAIPVSVPKMAYVYDYGFSVPGKEIAALQLRHADMCEALGPFSCQIVAMDHSGYGEDMARGELQLAVAADKARAFVGEVTQTLDGVEGEQVRANITGEDLSKSMVDTEARLRSRIALRDRMMDVLQTRRGTVAELVEAERSVASINEEIDQARSWMEEMKGRVAFTRVNLSYESATPVTGKFLAPVRAALGSLDSIFGLLLAVAVFVAALGVPMVLAALGGRKALRYWRKDDVATGAAQ